MGPRFPAGLAAACELRRRLGAPPLLALTATADAMTRADIVARLFTSETLIFVHGFDRPNLNLAFAPKRSTPRQIADFIGARRGQSGIVYCASRKRTERFAQSLAAAGHDAVAYHAGLDPGLRQAAQDRFQRDDGVVAVATVAVTAEPALFTVTLGADRRSLI